MPTALHIYLAGDLPADRFQVNAALYSIVLDRLGREEPVLAREFHDANQKIPLTISPLQRTGPTSALFEVCLLIDSHAPVLMAGFERGNRRLVFNTPGGRNCCRVMGVETAADAGWEQFFIFRKPPPSTWEFAITSPALHHDVFTGLDAENPVKLRRYNVNVVMPTPYRYFGSWLQSWNLCCETRIDDSLLTLVERRIAVAECNGETRRAVTAWGGSQSGFEGSVRFTVVQRHRLLPVDDGDLAALTALARFSRYCGTGVSTAWGLGQTEYFE